jgi:hypothetical protein
VSVRAQKHAADDDDDPKVSDDGDAKKGDDDDVDPTQEDEGDLLLIPHPDITVSAAFPDSKERKFVLGQPITILLGFNNKGDQAFNITGIGAHLQHPFDYSHYIQNFTARRVVGAPVGPRQQGSAEYVFQPDPSLEPLEYGFSAWVVYNNSVDQVFMHTFYNGTIELTEAPTELSAALIFSWGLTAAGAGIVGYVLLKVASSMKPKKKRGTKRVETGTREDTAVPSDIPVYTPAKGPPRALGRRSNSTRKPRSKSGTSSGGSDAEQ